MTFTHDLVDVTRQAIAKKASKIYRVLDAAAAANSTERVASAGKLLLEALDDADKVLGTSQGFLFGAWVDAAQKLGTTADEKELYGWNAKMQVTFWEYPQPDPTNSSAVFRPSTLQDYACKQWSGLLRTYYKPRWELFINQTLAQLKEDPKATFDIGKFYADNSYVVVYECKIPSSAISDSGNRLVFRQSACNAQQSWLHGRMSNLDANSKLSGKVDGTFFVRKHDSLHGVDIYILSVVYKKKPLHYRLNVPETAESIVGGHPTGVTGLFKTNYFTGFPTKGLRLHVKLVDRLKVIIPRCQEQLSALKVV